MKVLGYVNRFSRGVYRVQKELVENGNGQAEFDFSLITAFRVVERVTEKYFEEGFGTERIQEEPDKNPIKKPNKKDIQNEIIKLIKLNSQISREEMADRLNRSEDSVRYYLRELTKEGIIKREGSKKSGKWVIKS